MGALIRANTVIAKFRPLGMSLPERAGAAHKYSGGSQKRFGDVLEGGGGENKLL